MAMLRVTTFITAVLISIGVINAADLSKHVPDKSPVLAGYNDIDSVKAAIVNRGAPGIEGLWQLTDNQAIVVIEPATYPTLSGAGFSALQIVIVSSPRKSIRPGTVLGYIVRSASPGTFEACMYTQSDRALLEKHRRFILKLGDDNHLLITTTQSGWRLSLRHTFRFLARVGLSMRPPTSESNNGFIKLFPAGGGKPLQPVYL